MNDVVQWVNLEDSEEITTWSAQEKELARVAAES
jgi:hypothetical protein